MTPTDPEGPSDRDCLQPAALTPADRSVPRRQRLWLSPGGSKAQWRADFNRAVDMVLRCGESNGRVVVTGMGKSGIVAQKIAATLSSTGSPALFLHPAEAVHGDLGVLMPGDVVVALSASGETEEILRLPASSSAKATRSLPSLQSVIDPCRGQRRGPRLQRGARSLHVQPRAHGLHDRDAGPGRRPRRRRKPAQRISRRRLPELHPGGKLGNNSPKCAT